MATPQTGIFALGTRSHYHLEFDLRPDTEPAALLAALGELREPKVTTGGANLVIGFGA
ncbi:MAG: porphyrinogen peroxidase, partial [Acidimicrobiaceae bacterium]|nr:porphyrinogen peroxidase [Acidimicrobiaceae bacterium]